MYPNPKTPKILSQGGLPTGIAPSGSFANNGVWTSGTTLPTTYSGGIYLYFPADKIAVGVPAGLYYTVMSNGTVGTVYNNTYTSGVPTAPASPTAFATTGPGAYTQSTSEITLRSITLGGGSLGLDGRLVFNKLCSYPSNGNNKSFADKVGGTSIDSFTLTTTTNLRIESEMQNRGSLSKQISSGFLNYGTASSAFNYLTIDTSTDQNITTTSQLAVTTDFAIVESISIQIWQA